MMPQLVRADQPCLAARQAAGQKDERRTVDILVKALQRAELAHQDFNAQFPRKCKRVARAVFPFDTRGSAADLS